MTPPEDPIFPAVNFPAAPRRPRRTFFPSKPPGPGWLFTLDFPPENLFERPALSCFCRSVMQVVKSCGMPLDKKTNTRSHDKFRGRGGNIRRKIMNCFAAHSHMEQDVAVLTVTQLRHGCRMCSSYFIAAGVFLELNKKPLQYCQT